MMPVHCICQSVSVVVLYGQAYLISVVWHCYQYLVARQRQVLPTFAPGQLTSQPLSSVPSVAATVSANTTPSDAQVQ